MPLSAHSLLSLSLTRSSPSLIRSNAQPERIRSRFLLFQALSVPSAVISSHESERRVRNCSAAGIYIAIRRTWQSELCALDVSGVVVVCAVVWSESATERNNDNTCLLIKREKVHIFNPI